MGCILSIYKKRNISEEDNSLLNNYHCFVCNKTFNNNITYNRHIPKCNMTTLNKK